MCVSCYKVWFSGSQIDVAIREVNNWKRYVKGEPVSNFWDR